MLIASQMALTSGVKFYSISILRVEGKTVFFQQLHIRSKRKDLTSGSAAAGLAGSPPAASGGANFRPAAAGNAPAGRG